MIHCIPLLAATATLAPPAVILADQVRSRPRPASRYAIEQFFATRVTSDADWSPDGSRLVFVTNISGRANLWAVPVQGGWPTQLTLSDERQSDPAWSPDGAWIAFQSDHQADEQWDLFLVSPRSGKVAPVTETPEVSEEGVLWSPDGKRLAFASKPRRAPNYEIELIDAGTRERRALTAGTHPDYSFYPVAFSRDGRLVLASRIHASDKDADAVLVALDSGRRVRLTPHDGEQRWLAADLSPDGRQALVTSDARNGFDNVALLDLGPALRGLAKPAPRRGDRDEAVACPVRWLTEERWEITARDFAPDGRHVTWQANVDGEGDLYLGEVAGPGARRLALGAGYNTFAGAGSAFSRDGSMLAFFRSAADAPGELCVHELASDVTRQLTHGFAAGVDPADMVEPVRVRYPSRDGMEISAWLYVPWNLERDGSHPAVVMPHGGPTSQSLHSFHRAAQFLANQGYLVIQPNYRGSTGYGKGFMDANRRDMGGGDLEDCANAVQPLLATGYVDPRKVAFYGVSYGGYLTMMALTKRPALWAAGCALFPFVNWFTEIENEDPLLRQYDLATMGDPVKDADLYRERSPVFFVDRIRAPVFLVAGGNDPRCPPGEAQQVHDAIAARGGVCELRLYEDEGHGFARRENQFDAYRRVLEFLERHVRGRTAAP